MKIKLALFVIITLILTSCSSKTKAFIFNPYAVYTKENKFLVRYNYDSQKGDVVNDIYNRAIIRYDYSTSGRLEKIGFLDEDSVYSEPAFLNFEYTEDGKLEKRYYTRKDGSKLYHTELFFYDKDNLVDKIIAEGWISRYGLSGPGMSKFYYDEKKRIIKEEFYNCEGEPSIVGEPGFRYITYEYNEENQITKEI